MSYRESNGCLSHFRSSRPPPGVLQRPKMPKSEALLSGSPGCGSTESACSMLYTLNILESRELSSTESACSLNWQHSLVLLLLRQSRALVEVLADTLYF